MTLPNARVPVIGFAAFSGTGKTTLLRRLLPLMRERGMRIAMVKHAHHTFDLDYPGKDSYELRKAGADRLLIASRSRWALIVEQTEERPEPVLDELLGSLDQDEIDVVLVEGFKHEQFAKIELHRPSLGRPLLFPDDDTVVAVAADGPLERPCPLPVLDLNRPELVAEFVIDWCRDAAPAAARSGGSR